MPRKYTELERALRDAILSDGRTRYELAKLSGVSEAQLSLFVRRIRTINMDTAGKLAKVLGLKLVQSKER
ncbi:MAG: helix-turn-helix transcriptional regulator [Sedimentisphaerales bacterium]|nr:helix-turn-helix transcriptional regulator [Sedimentisphaerales bacterium]